MNVVWQTLSWVGESKCMKRRVSAESQVHGTSAKFERSPYHEHGTNRQSYLNAAVFSKKFHDSLTAGVNLEFFVNFSNGRADGLRTDPKSVSVFLVLISFGETTKNFLLPSREVVCRPGRFGAQSRW